MKKVTFQSPQMSHVRKALSASLSVLLVLTSWVPLALAQEAERPGATQDGAEFEPGTIHPLDQGDKAPFEGLLIEEDDLVRWRLYIERLEFRRGQELVLWEAKLSVERDLTQQKIAIYQAAAADREDLWEARAKELGSQVTAARTEAIEARKRGWYESPILWFSLGVVITGAGGVAIATAVK